MELGLYAFGDHGPDPSNGATITAEQRLRNLVEEIELADQVGLDYFGVGEHHRPDYVVSAYAMVLAAAASRTKRIRLGSAVTVLSSDDPVRVFQNHATLDLLTGGRAEIMAGRGSFKESFPLFGFDLNDYDELFAEKLNLLIALCRDEEVTWSGTGRFRSAVQGIVVQPRPLQWPFPLWIAVGGAPESAERAGHLGLPIALPVIGRAPENFLPTVDLYRQAGAEAGHDPSVLKIASSGHLFVTGSERAVTDEFWPGYSAYDRKMAPERGFPPLGVAQRQAFRGPRSWLVVGEPEQVAEMILFQHETLGISRYVGSSSTGYLPHEAVLRSIERFGTEVAPLVRAEVARRETPAVAHAGVDHA
jgi:probable LLM family oxidoreductase